MLFDYPFHFCPKTFIYLRSVYQCISLAKVSREIELNPGSCAVARMPESLGGLAQYVVIRLRVSTEIFLNRREFRFQNAFSRKNEGLETTRHAPIPVGEWVNEYKVEMRHCSFNQS